MREVDTNETSGKLGSAVGRTLIGLSKLRITESDSVLPGGDQIATLVTMAFWRRLSIYE